ncbi:uncharacterized protein LOC105649583 isoform X4 [Jatropha curcas]|uniref:uncharacterized protein LOC105649583 isoform X4 n=1 Tax=Jatropha curcas TaxID=180498 RepID=UPI0018937A5C|nr:uncharacterized protein LOC105649583 isoform X4 [Jatropha curcas]
MVAVYRILFPAIILSSLLDLTSADQQSNRHLLLQLDEAKLKISQLESSLEEIIQKVNARDVYLLERENQIQEMEKKINDLQSARSNLKGASLPVDDRIKLLEEEVRVLWETLRKNNFDLHVLESKAQEADDRLEAVTLQVERMAGIVSEQWIQIQQFEQALQLREMTISKYQRQMRASRCSFLKSLGPMGSYLFGEDSTLGPYISRTLHLLKRLYSTAKEYHHELQGFVKAEMDRHEFTAYLANEELIFFVTKRINTHGFEFCENPRLLL